MCDAVPVQDVPLTLREVRHSARALVDGVRYYSTIMAVNRAGASSARISDGFTVDLSPPECASILDGPGYDRAFVGPTTVRAFIAADSLGTLSYTAELAISWERFEDRATATESYRAGVVPETRVAGTCISVHMYTYMHAVGERRWGDPRGPHRLCG